MINILNYKIGIIIALVAIIIISTSMEKVTAQTQPQEKMILSDARLVDFYGNPEPSSISVNQMVLLTANVTNLQSQPQPFKFYVEVKDSSGHLDTTWMTGTLNQGKTVSPALSWTPQTSGQYTAWILIMQPETNQIFAQSNPMTLDVLDNGSQNTPTNITPVEQLMNREYQNPTAVGLVANGLVNKTGSMTPYDIEADKVMGYVHVNSLDAQGTPYSGASLQLNIMLHAVTTTGTHDIWLQNVIQFDDTTKRTGNVLDNVWSSDSHNTLQKCIFAICKSTTYYYKTVHPFKYTLPFSESIMISEQPIVGEGVQITFLYVGHGLVNIYDKKLIEIPGLKSASILIEPNTLTGYGVAHDAELVWGGVGGGSIAHFTSLDSQLALEYANGNYVWESFPYYFNKGLDTGESAQNLSSVVNQYGYGLVTSSP